MANGDTFTRGNARVVAAFGASALLGSSNEDGVAIVPVTSGEFSEPITTLLYAVAHLRYPMNSLCPGMYDDKNGAGTTTLWEERYVDGPPKLLLFVVVDDHEEVPTRTYCLPLATPFGTVNPLTLVLAATGRPENSIRYDGVELDLIDLINNLFSRDSGVAKSSLITYLHRTVGRWYRCSETTMT